MVTITGVVEGPKDGKTEGDCVGTNVGSLLGVVEGKDVVGLSVGALVGATVGDRVPPSTSRRIETSRPVVFTSASASTHSASANKFSNVHPADRYNAKAPVTVFGK